MYPRLYRLENLDEVSFEQATIYVDACFLLAFLDANGDEDGELVEQVLIKMQKDKIKNMIISNHVFSEVVQHLFHGHIYNVVYTAYQKFELQKQLSDDEENLLGDPFVARKLMQLVDRRQLDRLRKSQQAYIPVKDIIKQYKENFADRDSLNYYHEFVLDIFNMLFINLSELFGIEIEHVPSDAETFYLAQEFMRELQLEVKDSLHLAVAKQHGSDYFATLDGDFVHRYYNEEHLENTAILHISKRFI